MAYTPDKVRLFIPGPTEVHPKVLEAMSMPMVGHRSQEFVDMYHDLQPKLRELLEIRGDARVFLLTSSGTGAMECAARNFIREGRKALSVPCGAFSDRWYNIIKENGFDADAVEFEWGEGYDTDRIVEQAREEDYDLVTLVLNETSTGVMNPIGEIAPAIREVLPDAIIGVDAVSAMGGVRIPFEAWDLDFCFAGIQKAFGCPPGTCITAVSERAMQRSARVEGRGFYFDLHAYDKYHQRGMTPTTPMISQIHALSTALDLMEAEGIKDWYDRHRRMADKTRAWVDEHFERFAQPGFESLTLTTATNNTGADIDALNKGLRERGMVIGNGYGKYRNKSFRISHMGFVTESDLDDLFAAMEDILEL